MVSSVNSHTNATRIGWHLWEIDLRFATGLPPGWQSEGAVLCSQGTRATPYSGLRRDFANNQVDPLDTTLESS